MQKLSNDIIVILSSSAFLFLITLFIVFLLMAYKRRDYKHLQEKQLLEEHFNNQLLCSQIEVQEQTFMQIGKELHDNVGQLLSTSRMLIGLAERSMTSPPDALFTANATLGKAISELRSLSKSLDKEWLSQFNLIENLKNEITRINATATIHASLQVTHQPALPSSKQIILFRIIQEAIQNAIKHSGCDKLIISLSKQEGYLVITVYDNGKGFQAEVCEKGLGLKNMESRTQLLGGKINFISEPGNTTITIHIPENKNHYEN
jgi:Signal transduction histidine kinase